SQLPLGIYRKLLATEHLYLRTKEHPVIKELEAEGISYRSFDNIYEKHDQFEDVYDEIVDILRKEAKTKEIVYAVPGHPMVAEKTTQLLLEDQNLQVKIEGGQSFIDPLLASLRIDPIEGFQFIDALSFESDELQLSQHIIICQVYDQYIASNVKLTLMEQLPDEYEVYIVTAAGSKEEKITKVPLYELDRGVEVNNLTSVYVPPVQEAESLYHDFRTFRRIIAALRGPGGCPWDQKQTHQSLKKFLLEEAYEVLD
ncbi:SAM-dependent methyltransferase, partial [Aeromonas veronii]|nr:SAM-dependent methyltransferase [Aeromonas veronii]